MDDLDARLRTRLIGLAEAAAAEPVALERLVGRRRSATPVGTLLVAVIALVAATAGWALIQRSAGPAPSSLGAPASSNPTSKPSLPPGGISEVAAVQIARELSISTVQTLVSAEAGTFGALNTGGVHAGIADDRLVWAVKLSGTIILLGSGSSALSPSPEETVQSGSLTIFLDYDHGTILASDGSFSPTQTAGPVIICGDLVAADCSPAAAAVLKVAAGSVGRVSRVELGGGVWCPTPGLLFADTSCPAGAMPAPDGGQSFGHGLVTFQGIRPQLWVNLDRLGQSISATLIALATVPPESPPASTPPEGGIDQSTAMLVAQSHVLAATSPASFISAQAGPVEVVVLDAVGQNRVRADRIVWVVRFWGQEMTACPASGPTPPPQCFARVEVAVVLDFYTGEYLAQVNEGP